VPNRTQSFLADFEQNLRFQNIGFLGTTIMVIQIQLQRRTQGHGDVLDLTDELNTRLDHSGVVTGIAHLFVLGSTAALGAIEFEAGLRRDLPETLDRLIPPNPNYGHEQAWHDGNGHSHLQATLLGPSLSVPVRHGRLMLGTWQQVVLVECDIRPRERTIVMTVLGE
jgi:secondary thiamine-phosphate synthase enzyme